MKKIYLDYAATTPVDKEVSRKIEVFSEDKFGNPSSLHSFGQEALFAMDHSREVVADFLNCKRKEVYFLSSATEANNLAVFGVLKKRNDPHVIASPIEHKAVLEPIKRSGASFDHLPVSSDGIVKKEKLKELIRENTVLVSIGYANSEIGTLQPLKEISEIIREENKKRKEKIIFHTDAVQAANYLSCDVQSLGVDLLTISGHKMYGPKGAAALFIKEGVDVSPIIYGASQEKGLRPGTENVYAIAGLAAAIEVLDKNDNERTEELRDRIVRGVLSELPDAKVNGSMKDRLPNNINFTFKGAEGESIMIALDREGVAVSTGSACASNSLSPSHVLLSLGLSHEEAHGSIRVSLGRFTTKEEVDFFIEKLPSIVNKLRMISGK